MRLLKSLSVVMLIAGTALLGSGPPASAAGPPSGATARPGAAVHAPGAGTRAAGRTGPAVRTRVGAIPSLAGPLVNMTSRNWAGWAVESTAGTNFSHVHASWTQKAVTCPADNAMAVIWVGFDGLTNGTVEQGGSSGQCFNGVIAYTLWWQMFPTTHIVDALTIGAGDGVSADVSFTASTGLFTITLADATRHTSFTTSQACASNLVCNRSTAEWIVEAPASGNGFFPLANYGIEHIGNTVGRDDAGHGGSITEASSTWRRYRIQQQDATTTYATTSSTNTSGQFFSTTWMHQ
jgi:hypothetical protein